MNGKRLESSNLVGGRATLKMLFHKTEFATDILNHTFCSQFSYDITLTLI